MRRGILGIAGSRIGGVFRPRCSLRPIIVRPGLAQFRRRAVGQRIADILRLGKRVVLRLDSQDSVVLEPRMTGLVLLADPPDQKHLRLRFELSGGAHDALWFWDRRGLGSVQLLSAAEFSVVFGPERLGPDALELSAEGWRTRLGHSRRAIKVAMLDQRTVAGVGNLYASEILHQARIHPTKRCEQLTRPAWSRLQSAAQEVLLEAIRHEGSTLSDGTYRNALNNPGDYQNHHRVYGRQGERCPSCRLATVRRIVQAQRSTFFCPRCQRP
jgi:formamidopyrimidine-DNA glycosylase